MRCWAGATGRIRSISTPCLRLVYRFLGEDWFAHDFDNVEYDAPEFDGPLGAPGLHRVSGPVRAETRATVLPPDLFER